MDAQFEHLCRICAANTKCKNNSVVESVFIFKTMGLKDKIARHLYLNVAEDDPLPKVLCKSCYRQVEATASLSNIAKHTQRVFRDFVLSTVPKHAREATASRITVPSMVPPGNRETSDFNQHNNNGKNICPNLDNGSFHPILLTRPPETTITLAPHQANSNKNPDDVVISLTSKSNEIRRKEQPKHQHVSANVATQYTSNRGNIKLSNLMLPARRNSVFVDTRYSSAPMSIAQRSMQQPPSLAPLRPDLTVLNPVKSSPEKKNSPAGVINFIQTHGRITGNAPTITPCGNSKNYREDTSNSIRNKNALSASSNSTAPTVSSTGVPNLPNSVLQQKRRNLKNALSNISAIRDGQVSLLKSAHQRQAVKDVDIRPLVTTTVVPHLSLYGIEPSVEEALPEHIIIAAPKKKKEELRVLARPDPPKLQKITSAKSHDIGSPAEPAPLTAQPKSPPNISSLTEAISLGNVIRDPDLLKLILKALKWPVTTGNCEEQMTKLKNSKFAVIMSDNNLLQDNDLTQLLGPYLSPIMGIAQPQQKQQSSINKTHSPSASPLNTTVEMKTIGDCTMPYKLPPETSVQLVPTSPTEQEATLLHPIREVGSISKRSPRKSRMRECSAEELNNTAMTTTSNAALVANELLNINAMLISQFGSNPADALNEALISMLKQQQELKTQRINRRRRSASSTNTPINLEDIVLVEPQPSLESPPTSNSNVINFKTSQNTSEVSPITRPIIKRRKIIMQRLEQSDILTTKDSSAAEDEQCKDTEETISTPDPSKIEEKVDTQNTVEMPQAPTSTVPEVVISNSLNRSRETEFSTADATANTSLRNSAEKTIRSTVRRSDVKSDLGQKLLEAIGLPQLDKKVPPENSRDTLRSALKRSLKQAQEQQQLKRVKQEEPVKQVADSTTKPGAGESSDEHKKAIAERELELLKRKTKNTEKLNMSIKDEKSERTDVSSSSSRNRRNRNKIKTSAHEEDSGVEEKKCERWDDDDDLPLKSDLEKSADYMNRPTRTSKTLSKYYKSPGSDKVLCPQKSQHAMGTRSTRQR